MKKSKAFFYLTLLGELAIFPVLYCKEEIMKIMSFFYRIDTTHKKLRSTIVSREISICIHEWGGYLPIRRKKVRTVREFECGLHYQLKRFEDYQGNIPLNITVTVSEASLHNYDKSLIKDRFNFVEVSNRGFDFSGYAYFTKNLLEKKNSYVILMNSSVNSTQTDFIDSYVNYLENNLDVGLLGVSYCTKMHQSLIRNRFCPHVQSFFLMTTSDILREVIEKNAGLFPGEGIDHKLLLIRKGEIGLSEIILKLGYSLAMVLKDGNVFKFRKMKTFENGYYRWKVPHGEYRSLCSEPGKISPILS
jgi:hypothetical protein